MGKLPTALHRAARQTGYSVNHASTEERDLHSQTAEALSDLHLATEDNQTTVANLITTNHTLTDQVVNLTQHMADKDSEISKLCKFMEELTLQFKTAN
eukprot:13341980-Ditylum_brightwellii.AAC.1